MDSSSEISNSEFQVPEPGPSTLDDPWDRTGGLLLDGPLERASVSSSTLSFVTGFLGLAAAFILFQLVVSPVVLVVQIGLTEGGLEALQTMGDPSELLGTYTQELILSNSVGQVLGLAVPALLMARLHTRRVLGYVRFRPSDVRFVVLAAVGVIGLQPVVQWLVHLNRALPLPETVRAFEQTQMELIRTVLESGLGVTFNLLLLALIPAFCEEMLFRGYAQRQFERAAGPAGGILLSGLLFGCYHLRPSQFLPLAVLGLYLAYLTWRTGSLWPAIVVHLLHNGLAVVVSRYAQSHPEYSVETIEQVSVPWYLVVGGFAIVGGVLYVLHPLARRVRDA